MKKNKPRLYAGLDLEMTSTDITQGGICQIGMWISGATTEDFKGYFLSDTNPHFPYSDANVYAMIERNPEAMAVCKFTKERINKAKPLGVALKELNEFIRKWQNDYELFIVGSAIDGDICWLRQ